MIDANIQILKTKLSEISDSEQVIFVTNEDPSSIFADITVFEKNNQIFDKSFPDSLWVEVFSMKSIIGQEGFGKTKEGDRKSPVGRFQIGQSFGKFANPGTKMPYLRSKEDDYWVDDPESQFYNTLQSGVPEGRWKSAENLLRKDDLYDYAFLIEYNTKAPIDHAKGSCIFFHVWRESYESCLKFFEEKMGLESKNTGFWSSSVLKKGTMGCTSTSKEGVISLMKWLDPKKNPIIIQGPLCDIPKL